MSKVTKAFTIFILVTGFLFVSSPTKVFACSCIQPGGPRAEMAKFDAVFRGKVTKTVDPTAENIGAGTVTATFEVSDVWKGDVFAKTDINTSDSSAACGITFIEGEEYVVYANEEDDVLSTFLCSRTNQIENANADLTALGEGKAPTAGVRTNPTDTGNPVIPTDQPKPTTNIKPETNSTESDAYLVEWRASDQIVLAVTVTNLVLLLLLFTNQILVFRHYKMLDTNKLDAMIKNKGTQTNSAK